MFIYKLLENVLMGKCYKSVLLLETLICVIKTMLLQMLYFQNNILRTLGFRNKQHNNVFNFFLNDIKLYGPKNRLKTF